MFNRIRYFAVASVAALALASAAQAQTTVNTTWNGGGNVDTSVTATGSTAATFSTGGNMISGSFGFTNQGNNPYGYGVSNTTTNVNAAVGSGGFISSSVNRTGSYVPLYGLAGQSISAAASSSDGSAALVQNASVNYAGMTDIGYGQPKTAGGNTVDASGSNVILSYGVNTGSAGNNAGILVNASGSAALNLSSSGVRYNSFGMGQGQGIFTQANFSGTGIGTVSTGGMATGSLSVANSGSTVYGTVNNPASVTTNINYATTGNQVQSWNFALGGTSSGPATPPAPN